MIDDESEIAKNRGGLQSSRGSDLPSEAGLRWEYYDKGWHDDPNLTCTEVRGQQQHDRAGGGKGGQKRARRSGRRATQPSRPDPSPCPSFHAVPTDPLFALTSPPFSPFDGAACVRRV